MKKIILFIALFSCFHILTGQIIINNTTLPEIGDELEYRVFANYNGTPIYKEVGTNLTWEFNNFTFVGNNSDNFTDIQTTNIADTFPTANMLVNIGGFDAAAIRSENKIEVIGLAIGQISGFDLNSNAIFADPFTYRTTPFAYLDSYTDEFDFVLQLPSSAIPGLDTLSPLPGVTIDSFRVTTTVMRSEVANGWGKISVFGTEMDVLKIDQKDSTKTKIDVLLKTGLGFSFWQDAAPFIGAGLNNFNRNVVTHKFIANGSKKSVIEFTETSITDTAGVVTTTVNGRMSSDIMTSVTNTLANSDYSIYPNPTSSVFNINDENSGIKVTDIHVYNVQGQLVKTVANFNGEAISLENQVSGIYIVQLLNNTKIVGKQLIHLVK